MKRIKLGDIVEIETKIGFAYAMYTYNHRSPPVYGALLRVFDRVWELRPQDIADVVMRVRFNTFFPLQAAVNRGLVKIVGNVPIPEELKELPLFRTGNVDRRTKRVPIWSLWHGERSWRVGDLTSEQRALSILGVCNDTFLIERIESGWRPETDMR
jgi:hypothetical protein